MSPNEFYNYDNKLGFLTADVEPVNFLSVHETIYKKETSFESSIVRVFFNLSNKSTTYER